MLDGRLRLNVLEPRAASFIIDFIKTLISVKATWSDIWQPQPLSNVNSRLLSSCYYMNPFQRPNTSKSLRRSYFSLELSLGQSKLEKGVAFKREEQVPNKNRYIANKSRLQGGQRENSRKYATAYMKEKKIIISKEHTIRNLIDKAAKMSMTKIRQT